MSKQTAGLRQRPQGGWEARYYGPDGRRRSKTFARKTDARKFLDGAKTDIRRGSWVDPALGRVKYEKWAETWTRTMIHLKPKTVAGYESLLRVQVLPIFGDQPLGRIDPMAVREWIADLAESGLSASRIRQSYQLLSASLKAAVESGYLARTPCIGIRLPKAVQREMLFLDPDEIASLASAIASPFGSLVYFAAYSGLRWGELTALRISRLDLLRARVHVVEAFSDVAGKLYLGSPKSGRDRVVTIPPSVAEMLEPSLDGRGPDALVFTAAQGGPLRHGNFYRRQFKPAVGRGELLPGLRFHDLRHSCAALLVAQGAHPRAVMEHLGHSSISVTMDRYGHLFPDEKNRLAEGLDAALRRAEERRDGSKMGDQRGLRLA